jgi:hypothetical protein
VNVTKSSPNPLKVAAAPWTRRPCGGWPTRRSRAPALAPIDSFKPTRRATHKEDSEPECVLKFRRQPRVLPSEVVAMLEVLNPALPEDEEEVIPGLQRPSHPALQTEIRRPVIELDQIGKRKERRHRIVHFDAENSRHEIALRQPGEGLIGSHADKKVRRDLVG